MHHVEAHHHDEGEANVDPQAAAPSPMAFFDALHGYQRTETLKAAVELRLFDVLLPDGADAAQIAAALKADVRGVRILCDSLAIHGFLVKQAGRYRPTPDTAIFLDSRSPAYLGGTLEFLLSDTIVEGFRNLAQAVRTGRTALADRGTMETQHPVWVEFARVMGPMIAQPADAIATIVDPQADRPLKILDVAAGHGLFGIAFARRNPGVRFVSQDWASVLEVARRHAQQAGVADRQSLLPGDAFEVDLGSGYDVVLLTNFLHHFDVPTCERMLRRVRDCLAPRGVAATLDFVPNADRISPPAAAGFALTMLATTVAGDAYTFDEYDAMFRHAGFGASVLHALPPGAQSLIVTQS